MEALPDNWMKLTPPQLDNLAQSLSPDSEYIDWRTFLLQTAQPWPQPSQAQLLETLQRFYDADVLNAGMITRDQYEQVSVFVSSFTVTVAVAFAWYTRQEAVPLHYDRVEEQDWLLAMLGTRTAGYEQLVALDQQDTGNLKM